MKGLTGILGPSKLTLPNAISDRGREGAKPLDVMPIKCSKTMKTHNFGEGLQFRLISDDLDLDLVRVGFKSLGERNKTKKSNMGF